MIFMYCMTVSCLASGVSFLVSGAGADSRGRPNQPERSQASVDKLGADSRGLNTISGIQPNPNHHKSIPSIMECLLLISYIYVNQIPDSSVSFGLTILACYLLLSSTIREGAKQVELANGVIPRCSATDYIVGEGSLEGGPEVERARVEGIARVIQSLGQFHVHQCRLNPRDQ